MAAVAVFVPTRLYVNRETYARGPQPVQGFLVTLAPARRLLKGGHTLAARLVFGDGRVPAHSHRGSQLGQDVAGSFFQGAQLRVPTEFLIDLTVQAARVTAQASSTKKSIRGKLLCTWGG
jgi:hypothetical protein